MDREFIIESDRVLLPEGFRPARLVIRNGRIDEILETSTEATSAGVLKTGSVVMPGVIDTHVHVNEPGRTEWEGFESLTKAAAAGGVTTVVDMPLNSSPVTTNVAAFHSKVEALEASSRVCVGLWGGVVPGNLEELSGLWDAGVLGFKCFLSPSGIDEFAPVGPEQLRPAMARLAALGAVLLAHAEDPAFLHPPARPLHHYIDYERTRPESAEVSAVAQLIALCEETGCRVHIVHVAASGVLEPLAKARDRGLPVTAETCPHYLTFRSEDIRDCDTVLKCAPPIRSETVREKLWQGLSDGVLDLVASDHSPCPPQLKSLASGDFVEAWGGIASVQLSLPAVWTGARRRGIGIEHVAEWMCSAPARLAGIDRRKGAIAPGYDADLVIWNPEQSFEVEQVMIRHRHPNTPYLGMRLHGVVETTIVSGQVVFDRGADLDPGVGGFLARSRP